MRFFTFFLKFRTVLEYRVGIFSLPKDDIIEDLFFLFLSSTHNRWDEMNTQIRWNKFIIAHSSNESESFVLDQMLVCTNIYILHL